MKQLEAEGILLGQGRRRQRRIALDHDPAKRKPLRVKILLYDRSDRNLPFNVHILAELQKRGIEAAFARKSLQDLGMQVERVSAFVARTPADAWVVLAGSRDVLAWFARQQTPALAIFGIFTGLPIAATSLRKTPAMRAALRRLADLGHRRIVLLTREERRKPEPALFERNYLDELAALGLRIGSYNLPDWEESRAGLQKCLDALFAYTPPTALLIEDIQFFIPVQQYLAHHKIEVPGQVSLICHDSQPIFDWSFPAIAQISGDYDQVVKKAVRWAENAARGKANRRQVLVDAAFVEGGTIGPLTGGRGAG